MIVIVGFIVVLASVLGGFKVAGGHFGVFLAWSEWIVICGVAVGTLLVSTPGPVLKLLMRRLPAVFTGGIPARTVHLDCLRLLYELFQLARKDGLIAIESHVEAPDESVIFKRYPAFSSDHHAVEFLCDALRTILAGSVPAHDLEALMDMEIEVHHDAEAEPVKALNRVADAMPAIGIVAAVLGIVVTMGALGGPIDAIGHHVAAALVGTFLGILLSYGFVAPLASNLEQRNQQASRVYFALKSGLIAFAKNLPPMVAAEFARKAIPADDRPTFQEMEAALKSTRQQAREQAAA